MTNTEKRLSQASGALSDIQILVTSCVNREAPKETQELAETILLRILCSADQARTKPSFYIHVWEKKAWERYLKACASDMPCINVSKELAGDKKVIGLMRNPKCPDCLETLVKSFIECEDDSGWYCGWLCGCKKPKTV